MINYKCRLLRGAQVSYEADLHRVGFFHIYVNHAFIIMWTECGFRNENTFFFAQFSGVMEYIVHSKNVLGF